MSKTLEQFEQYLDKMKKYEHINTLLYWDMRTCAPKPVSYTHLDVYKRQVCGRRTGHCRNRQQIPTALN